MQSYFQQDVAYNIRVTLDDVNHFLRGEITIGYTNNSPDTLRFIMFHLWPNAYKNNSTAFAKQLLENGKTGFEYAADSSLGFIDSLNFLSTGLKTITEYDSLNPDIIKVILPVPLFPGKKTIFYTPFRVKIPYTFSRMGHVGQQYQISQWYPKPAVYDRYGWHAFPYLDQGEFYSEFGSFDVHIMLPENYVVGATGILENENEKKWLDQKADTEAAAIFHEHMAGIILPHSRQKVARIAFPPSAKAIKTLRYTADLVHDFAWFADKRYHVMKSAVALPQTGRVITTWAMFLPSHAAIWRHAVDFADSSLFYYSKWIGEYPYDQATVVDGALNAGGGMEYPMITVISENGSPQLLDDVIAHELGHNWFYGILGFNEREHPWMDEGINSYYENRYVEKRYPLAGIMMLPPGPLMKWFGLAYPHHAENYFSYLFFARQKNDQPMDQNAALFTEGNYAAMVYAKTAEIILYLQQYLGQQKFDSIMQQFFIQWKFMHPYPDDLAKTFENSTGKELGWFFNQLIPTTDHLDYKIVKKDVGLQIGDKNYDQLKVRNKGEVKGPYPVAAFKNGRKIKEVWYGGFNGTMDILFPAGDYDYYKIDADHELPEVNRHNNYLRTSGVMKRAEPLRLQWIGSVENPDKNQIFFTPLTGYNLYDGFTPGLALYNSILFPEKINLALVPQYGLHSGKFTGVASADHPFYFRKSLVHAIDLSVGFKSYSYGTTKNYGDTTTRDLRFIRWSPALSFDFRNGNPRSTIRRGLIYRAIFIYKEQPYIFVDQKKFSHQQFNVLTYNYDDHRVINPYHLDANAETGIDAKDHYLKFYARGNFEITYPGKKSGLDIRAFTGIFLSPHPQSIYAFHLTSTTGPDDYRFDHIFLGRSETGGFFSQQIEPDYDGGFKIRSAGVLPVLGASDSWIFSLNIKLPLPLFMPMFAFADGGFAQNPTYDVFQYDAGIGIKIIPDIVEVYLPLFFSNDIKLNLNTIDFYKRFYQRITFTFNADKLNPFTLIRNFSL